MTYTADPFHHGMRLDRFLVDVMADMNRSRAQRIIKSGGVLVNGRTLPAGKQVVQGDVVRIRLVDRRVRRLDARTLPILYRDEFFVAVDKPPHMIVHPVGRSVGGTVLEKVREMLARDVLLGNRIDRETSGVVLLTLDRQAKVKVQRMFERREVDKVYLAVTRGMPQPPEGCIDLPIGIHPTAPVRIKQAVNGLDAKPCLSHYRVKKQFGAYALVELKPHTGRQHQLRVHMDAIGCPLVGDRLYGVHPEPSRWPPEDFPETAPIKRQALHAWRLMFRHPISGTPVEIEAPLAQDMRALLA